MTANHSAPIRQHSAPIISAYIIDDHPSKTHLSSRKCKHIPKDMKERYMHLKNNQGGMSRGRKKYWVTSAMRKGLCDGSDGIVIRNAQQQGKK